MPYFESKTMTNIEHILLAYKTISNDPRLHEFMAGFPLNSFWVDNVSSLQQFIMDSKDAEDVVHRAQQTFFFSVNTSDSEKNDAVDWLLQEQRSRGLDLFSLPEVMQESQWSFPGNNVCRSGRRLTPDFLRTVNISSQIATHVKPRLARPGEMLTVLELGAGLGHLARTLRLVGISQRHVIVDIPETLVFSYCFLSLNFPEARCIMATDAAQIEQALNDQVDFLFVPNFLAQALVGASIDLFVNTASLGEMQNETIRHWMTWLQTDINPKYLFTLNRYFNTVNPAIHASRWGENECSLIYDDRWKMINWELSPPYTRCPYIDPLVARYVEIIAYRLPTADTDNAVKAKSLLNKVARQDWYRFRDQDATMTMRDNDLTPDLTMGGALFSLWESLRLAPSARGAAMMVRYMRTLLHRSDKEFEEEDFYRRLFISLLLYEGDETLISDKQYIRSLQEHSVQQKVELLYEGDVYNIVKAGERYIALSKALGIVHLFSDRIGERDQGSIILVDGDLENLKRRIEREVPSLSSIRKVCG
jgi:putative sugar O-methyltransferase